MPYRKPISPPEPGCTQFFECLLSNPDPAALLLLATGAGVFLVLALAALAHITGARSLLECERDRVTAEAEAFGAFARRVADLETSGTSATVESPGATTALETATADTRLQQVREAYRETVMSVDHYGDEYDEPLATNMAIEFGEDVATAVGNGRALTPQLKSTLVERSRGARRQRILLLGQLETEAEALDDAGTELAKARRSADRLEEADLDGYTFEELTAEWHLLEDRRRETEAVLAERQETVQTRDRDGRRTSNSPSFEEYLYEPLAVTYPVLSDGATLLDRLEATRSKVARALADNG